MCIQNYQTMLMEIKNKILNKEFKHRNTIIVGDNSSGKSEILRQILKHQEKGYYFIDSVNRSFNYEKVSKSEDLFETYKYVLKYRLSENKFNLVDSFDLQGTGLDVIEKIYFNYDEELKAMLKSFLNIDFRIDIVDDKVLGKKKILNIDNNIAKLSSGYQAIIRLFLELIYFKDSLEKDISNPTVVIDEINEFLSTKNEERILPYLIKIFKNMNFIVTTHSADVVASSIDCNVIVISGNNYECLDGNDFSSVTDVREVFEKIYNVTSENKILQPFGIKNKVTERYYLIQYDLLNQKFIPSNRYDYSSEEKKFIDSHISRFNLNDCKYRTREFSKFLEDVIEYKAIPKKNRYCNLVVDLFIEKIKEFSKEKSIKLCEVIYTQILIKNKN